MTFKNTLLTLLVSAIVGVAVGLTLISYRPQSTSFAKKNKDAADAFMEDVVAVVMDKQGKPKMGIVTPKMVHYAEQDTTRLIEPKLTIYRKSPQPWVITSRFAKATQGIEVLNFWENVVIHHPADGSNPATLIKTATLNVFPNQQTAETEDSITFIQPHLTINAVGMKADMNVGNIKLLSQSRGLYAPGH